MNTTTRQGFTAEVDNFTRKAKRIYCAGANHKDMATFGCCDGCGAFVAKTASGRIVTATTGGTNRMSYCCWAPNHECDPERAAAYAACHAARIERGDMEKGQTVTVVKGRKVPKGTTGVIFWVGEDSWGKGRIGFKGTDGETYWTATSNVEVTA